MDKFNLFYIATQNETVTFPIKSSSGFAEVSYVSSTLDISGKKSFFSISIKPSHVLIGLVSAPQGPLCVLKRHFIVFEEKWLTADKPSLQSEIQYKRCLPRFSLLFRN